MTPSIVPGATAMHGVGTVLIKLLATTLAVYSVLLLLAFVWQRRMLYLPNQQATTVAEARQYGLQHWPDRHDFRGFVAAPKPGFTTGTVIIFHGNAGAAQHRAFYRDALRPLGLRVILAEYPGYGGRRGNPSEALLIDDALATLRSAHQHFGGPIYLWGESLGCGVVSGVVKRLGADRTGVPIAGVVLLLPWDTLLNVAQSHYPFLPLRWLLRDHYRNVDNLRRYRGKIAVLVANNDEVIAAPHGIALYEQLLSPEKRLWVFAHATHNNLPIAPEHPWWREVIEFISH